MDLDEACENGNEERVVEVLIYGEHGLAFGRHRRRRLTTTNSATHTLAASANANANASTSPSRGRGRNDAASLADAFALESTKVAMALAASAKQLLSPGDILRTRGTAGRTPLLAACMGAQLGVVRLLLGESCVVYFTGHLQHETEALLQPLAAEYKVFAETQPEDTKEESYFHVTMAEKDAGNDSSNKERVPMATVRFPPAYAVAAQDLLDGMTHVDDFGNTPLQCVSCFGCGTTETHVDDGLALVQQLLRHGDQPNLPKIANQWTPLHWAAYNGNHDMCGILLDPATAIETDDKETAPPLGKTQFSIPLLVNNDNLFAADVAGRRGLALAQEMRTLRAMSTSDRDEYARWRLRLDHVATLRLFAHEFLANARSLVQYVSEMNARLPRQLLGEADKSRRHRHPSRRLFTCADAIRYGQHLLYWMGCFGLENDVRALLEMPLQMSTDLAADLDAGTPFDASGAFTVVHLRPLYVCSCEENKRQSVLHAVAAHGQQGIVMLLLDKMLYEQRHAQSAALIGMPVLQTKKTERNLAAVKRTSAVAPSSSTAASQLSDGLGTPADPEADDPTKLDVLPLVASGWRNYRNESPLFLAVLFLRDDVIVAIRGFLSTASLAWELGNCNVEGSFINHVASGAARRTLRIVEAHHHQRLVHAEYVMLFDGLTKRPFKESLLEAMREESVVAPSLRVTPVGHRLTPPSLFGLVPASCTDYVVVGATDKVLVRHAQALQLKIKHRGSTLRSKYNAATPQLFEPFRSLQRQQVVLDIVQKNANLQKHLEKKNLRAIFPLHDASGCKNIMRHWVRSDDHLQTLFQPFVGNSLSQFLLERRTHQYEMLWPLLTYFGEKHAFYYAFLLFYTVWLVVLAIPGAVCQVAWSVGHAKYVTPLFAVFTSLWATLFVERWKRKRSEIQSTFGNFKRNRNEQAPAFYGDFQVDAPERGVVDTTFPRSLQLARIYAGLPLLCTMAGLVIAIFIGVKLNASSTAILQTVFPWMPATLSPYVIPVLNAVSMLVLDNVYTQVALALTQWENHRTVWEFESMLATKLFWFKFLNAFLSLFWVAFVDRDAPALRKQLVIIMGARQIWYMVQRSILPLLSVARAWDKAGFALGSGMSIASPALVGEKSPRKRSWFSLKYEWYYVEMLTPSVTTVDASNATPPPIVLLQELMQPSDFLLGKQMEVVLHFGYITMFVSVLPMAPLLALGSVVVSTRLDVVCCTQAKRRPRFESETEVSTFMSILEFMSFAAVAVNCAVLFFTTMDDFDSLLVAAGSAWQSSPSLNSSSSSSTATTTSSGLYLRKLWVLLVLEHVVLGLKALLSLTIDDAAAWVQNDEDRQDDEAKQTAQLDPAQRNTRLASLGNGQEEKLRVDAVAQSSLSRATDNQHKLPPTLAKVATEKYELVVRERDAAVERERQLERQLIASHRRVEELVAMQVLHSARPTPRTLPSLSSACSSPQMVPPTPGPRSCWICFLLHERRATAAQKRCLTCRQFFCVACDATIHLDDLGVREPKHFRVNATATASLGSNERSVDVHRPDTAHRIEPESDGRAELYKLLVEYLCHDGPVDSDALETLVRRCQGSEMLVTRYLRNTQRQRAFEQKSHNK